MLGRCSRRASPTPRPSSARPRRAPATCPTTGWRPRRSWRSACAARCSSRATPASARPRWRRRWPTITGARLLRLQCYEGIDASQALYDWDFPRQILHLRAAAEPAAATPPSLEAGLYDRRYLVARPILQALEGGPAVLLVDEIDRADDEFEAFLLEVLAENSVTIPELGTITRRRPAAGRDHLQPHPRGARRAQAPLPLPLGRAPATSRARSRSCAGGCPR